MNASVRSTSNFVELPGSNKRASLGSKVGAPTPPDEVFTVLIRLHRRHPLPKLTGSPRTQMTHQDYAARHSANTSDINRIKAFAEKFRLQVDAVLPVERSIILKGTAKAFSKAFQVEFHTHVLANGKSYRGREGKIFIPASLKDIVMGVFGLDARPVVHSHVRLKPLAKSDAAHEETAKQETARQGSKFQTRGSINPFYANQLATLYDFPAATDGSGQTIGIVEIGGGFAQPDLDKYFQGAGITNPPHYAVATVPGGASNAPAPDDPDLPDVEVLLDMEVAGSVAPGASFLMFFGQDGSTKQTMLAVQAAVHYQPAPPNVLSLSWGGEEYDSSLGGGADGVLEQQYQDNMNDLFQTAAHLGITVCVSSGDDGSASAPANDPQDPWDGHAHVNFPASSPYVLAVGGTHIVSATGKTVREEAWHPGANVGSGGGISRYFPRPAYQQNAVSQSAVNPAGGTGRGVPDVSADAAQESGYIVNVDGHSYPGSGKNFPPIGGTSASAPLWAALIARLNQALKTNLGFVNPLLYQIKGTSAFRDISKGNNGDYKAGTGWDPCTGLGVPDGGELLQALSPLITPATASLVKARAAASTAGKSIRNRGPLGRPTPEQISGEVSRRITQFDTGDPSTYFSGGVAPAVVNTREALSPINWPSKAEAPIAVPLSPAPDPEAPLSQYDYLIVTWTTEEAKALADVLTPGYPSKTAWYHYTHNFTTEFVPLIQPTAPSVTDSHRLGSFFPTTIAGKKVLCFKSELHLNQDGPKLPILKLWKQLISEVSPKLVITTGTGGGIGSYVELGDVIVASSVRFDCNTKFKAQPFAHSVYPCSNLNTKFFAAAEPLFAANASQLPAASRLPTIINQTGPGVLSTDVVTTDFFAYDDVLDTYGLQGLGACCDEGDAALGLVIQQLKSSAPKWAAVRNASDAEIQDKGLTTKQAYELATSYYGRYGYWTTIPSAITCWALVLGN